ncbi:hypothetical protein SAMN04515620_1352 [Collimonas sp. OK607]|uniref:hypothetical protein n=1 Tax=Collimonas sp. OK607 TaxID=1798194 RepID=UPI0008E30393|nr:hypothetical protein [Collimonas sp. OK607]SFB28252.1 hypothetical protein SAMN04515620_1352 [Collimonas sp. OK607]
MAKTIEEVLARQKEGAQFVLSAPLLGLELEDFDTVAKIWVAEGGPGFKVAGVPHRKCVDGDFFIDRVTVVKLPIL